jgi:hypothetical protein
MNVVIGYNDALLERKSQGNTLGFLSQMLTGNGETKVDPKLMQHL